MQRLYVGHALAVLAFELANRAYFATFDVLVAEDCSVPGRLNLSLVFTEDGTAELGYRVAQPAASQRREDVPAFVELESGGPPPGAFRMVGHG